MNDKNGHHVEESMNQLVHDPLNHFGLNLIFLKFHNLLEVAAVAEFHKNIISGVGLDGLSHFGYII